METPRFIYMMYLNSINFASITNIEWMYHEQEDNGFKYCLAGVSKNENHQKKLRAYEK